VNKARTRCYHFATQQGSTGRHQLEHDSYPAGLGALGTVPIDVPLPVAADDKFSVSDGVLSGVFFVVAASFLSPPLTLPTFSLLLNPNGEVVVLSSYAYGIGGNFVEAYQLSTFPAPSPSATPLPAALPLFAAGLGAMGLLGWRRKRKQVAAV
jgi:hypothetical protein